MIIFFDQLKDKVCKSILNTGYKKKAYNYDMKFRLQKNFLNFLEI